MSASTFVVTWVLQSTVLGLVALLLPALFRLRDPKGAPVLVGNRPPVSSS